jgi:hypothetical protein
LVRLPGYQATQEWFFRALTADEQYLARLRRRELPETIERLTRRVEALQSDLATLTAHADDPVTVDGRPCRGNHVLDVLGSRLDALPERVRASTPFALGTYRGLAFGILLHANGAGEVYLEGAVSRHSMLSRDHRGPRAVLNALERLAGSYGDQLATATRDLEIARNQLKDYQARLDLPFAHASYLEELTGLRDQLKAALSGVTPEAGAEPLPASGDIAERIKDLKSAHTIEAAPERPRIRSGSAAEAVTTRIRRRAEPAAYEPPPAQDEASAPPPADSTQIAPEGTLRPLMLYPQQADAAPSRPRDAAAYIIPLRPGRGEETAWNDDEDALPRMRSVATDRAETSDGSILMAKPKKNRGSTAPAEIETPVAEPAAGVQAPIAAENATPEPQETAGEPPTPEHAHVTDPRRWISASLSGYRGGPSMHLLRSLKYNQMQILFDGAQPDERHLAMLKQAGWRDRTEAEGVWTKQIDKNGRWQSVDRMEKEFRAVANAIRQEKGMAPVLEGLGVA